LNLINIFFFLENGFLFPEGSLSTAGLWCFKNFVILLVIPKRLQFLKVLTEGDSIIEGGSKNESPSVFEGDFLGGPT
jgi:hypothetical protein